MPNKNVESFVEKYTPVAQQVGKEIGVDPNVLLSQWALETGWGKNIIPGTNNLGNIKDFSGYGKEATDSHTKSKDKYIKFEDPEVFGMYYADMIKRQFPDAVNTGTDIGAFTRGLTTGKSGSYFEIKPDDYAQRMANLHNMIPGADQLPAPGAVSNTTATGGETDEDRERRIQAAMDAQERRQSEIYGAAVGAGMSATRAAGSGAGAALQSAAQRVGQGFRTGMQGGIPEAAPGVSARVPGAPAPVSGAAPQGGLSIMRHPAAGPLSNLTPNDAQSARILQGTTDSSGTTGRARMGFNETTAQQAAARKDIAPTISKLQQMGLVSQDAPTFFSKQPGMTSTPSGVQYPATPAPMTLGPRGPEGQIGYTRPAAPPPPPPPSFSSKVASKVSSGLDSVNELFRGLMRPVSPIASTVGRYAMPPLALASAAGEGTNIAQQMRKPENERDLTSAALSAGSILGSGLSMFPATAGLGIPIILGTGAAQAYREKLAEQQAYRNSPEFQEFIRKKLEQPEREIYAP